MAQVVGDTSAELTFVECAPRLERTAQARVHPAQSVD